MTICIHPKVGGGRVYVCGGWEVVGEAGMLSLVHLSKHVQVLQGHFEGFVTVNIRRHFTGKQSNVA